jgi:hypothetical protein
MTHEDSSLRPLRWGMAPGGTNPVPPKKPQNTETPVKIQGGKTGPIGPGKTGRARGN